MAPQPAVPCHIRQHCPDESTQIVSKTAECAKLSREKAPQDVCELAARDKAEDDAIHEEYYIRLQEDKRRQDEESLIVEEENKQPIGEFDTPSSVGSVW